MKKLVVLAAMLSVLSVGAMAGIYTDALGGGTGGNTFRASDNDPSAWQNTGTTKDGLWRYRTGFANNDSFALGTPGNDIFESSGTAVVEDCVTIYTVVSGLTAGKKYDVDVVYWSADWKDVNGQRHNWTVKAGFALDSLATFDAKGVLGTPGTASGKKEVDRNELLGRVGQAIADTNGQIRVYIDDLPANKTGQNSQEYRTWYDGILVNEVPEPATMILLGLGGLVLKSRKR